MITFVQERTAGLAPLVGWSSSPIVYGGASQLTLVTLLGEGASVAAAVTAAQVVNARQEGLAALERARGETAALRNLANAAKLLDDHPRLLQLRMLQAVGESTGNTLVVNAGDGGGIIPVAGDASS